jgi:hypothetical protein
MRYEPSNDRSAQSRFSRREEIAYLVRLAQEHDVDSRAHRAHLFESVGFDPAIPAAPRRTEAHPLEVEESLIHLQRAQAEVSVAIFPHAARLVDNISEQREDPVDMCDLEQTGAACSVVELLFDRANIRERFVCPHDWAVRPT